MIAHKQRRHSERSGRSRGEIDRALARLRKGGKCATRKPRFPNFGAAVAGALLASPELGQLRVDYCDGCGGFHLTPTKKGWALR